LLIVQSCGKDLAVIEQDSQRAKYLSPEEAVQYGLIDKVLYPEELRKEVRHNAYSTLGGELSFTMWCLRFFFVGAEVPGLFVRFSRGRSYQLF
jgi:hypothetical protein